MPKSYINIYIYIYTPVFPKPLTALKKENFVVNPVSNSAISLCTSSTELTYPKLQYFVHFENSLLFDFYVCISSTFKVLFFNGLLRQYLAHFEDFFPFNKHLVHFQDFLLFDCNVSISRTFRTLSYWIVTLSHELLIFSFTGLLRQYLARFQNSRPFDCYFSILRTFRILSHWIVALPSYALKKGKIIINIYIRVLSI